MQFHETNRKPQSVGLSVGRSVDRSIGRSVGRSVDRSIGRSVDRSVSRSVDRSAGVEIKKSKVNLVKKGKDSEPCAAARGTDHHPKTSLPQKKQLIDGGSRLVEGLCSAPVFAIPRVETTTAAKA